MPLGGPWIKGELHKTTLSKWERRWQNRKSCRQTRLVLPSPWRPMSSYLFNLNRTEIGRMVQFITGHNHLRYHQFLTKLHSTSSCRCCGEDRETAWHLFADCPALARDRMFFFLDKQSQSFPEPCVLHTFINCCISDLLPTTALSDPAQAPPGIL